MSDNPREGHVEVFLENEWGTISTIEFDKDTTTVVCRQLGFHGPAESIKSTEHLGPLSSPEWNLMCPEEAESILDCDRSKREGNVIDLEYGTMLSWKHDNDLGVICKELEGSFPSWMLVVDVALSLLLFAFILLFAYLAYYFAKRGKTTPCTNTPTNPDPSSNVGYVTQIDPSTNSPPNPEPSSDVNYITPIGTPKHEYSRRVVVEERASGEAEDINMKVMTIVEDKEGSTYATCE
ncbi:hypothetical protein BSL78_06789 [Apostichopus japonicus]|uniref:SRCR domain-containing protein n=1 Tax=Stichopus japonicus TaxID=307972 RepID=A0A2G8L7R0_STIJA|nr:hypothetical protein BSL78_06789 [Apostichopus japonicus]